MQKWSWCSYGHRLLFVILMVTAVSPASSQVPQLEPFDSVRIETSMPRYRSMQMSRASNVDTVLLAVRHDSGTVLLTLDLVHLEFIDSSRIELQGVWQMMPDGETIWCVTDTRDSLVIYVFQARPFKLKQRWATNYVGKAYSIYPDAWTSSVYIGVLTMTPDGSITSESGCTYRIGLDLQGWTTIHCDGAPTFAHTRSRERIIANCLRTSRNAKGGTTTSYSAVAIDTTLSRLSTTRYREPVIAHDDLEDVMIVNGASPGTKVGTTGALLHAGTGWPLKQWSTMLSAGWITDTYTGEQLVYTPSVNLVNVDTTVFYAVGLKMLSEKTQRFTVHAYSIPSRDTGATAVTLDSVVQITYPVTMFNRSYGASRHVIDTRWLFEDSTAYGRKVVRTFNTPGRRRIRMLTFWSDGSRSVIDTSIFVVLPSPLYRWHQKVACTTCRDMRYEYNDQRIRLLQLQSTIRLDLDSAARSVRTVTARSWVDSATYHTVWENGKGLAVQLRELVPDPRSHDRVIDVMLSHEGTPLTRDTIRYFKCNNNEAYVWVREHGVRDVTIILWLHTLCPERATSTLRTYTYDKYEGVPVARWNRPSTWQYASYRGVTADVSNDHRVMSYGALVHVDDRQANVVFNGMINSLPTDPDSMLTRPAIAGRYVVGHGQIVDILEGIVRDGPIALCRSVTAFDNSPYVVAIDSTNRVVIGDAASGQIIRVLFTTPFRILDLDVSSDRRHIAMLDDRGYVFEYEVDSLRDFTTSVNDRPDRDVHAGEALDARLIPNPTTGSVRLEGVPPMAHVRIVDHWGAVMSTDQQLVDTTTWPAGSYVVIVDAGTQRRVIPLRVVR